MGEGELFLPYLNTSNPSTFLRLQNHNGFFSMYSPHSCVGSPARRTQTILLRTTFLTQFLSKREQTRLHGPRGSWLLPRGHRDLLLRRRELTIIDRTRLALPTRWTAWARTRRPGPLVRRAGDGAALRASAPRGAGPGARLRSYKTSARSAGTGSARGPPFRL